MTATAPFARRVAGFFATRVVRYVIGYATSFLLARVLGPSGRGAYALAVLTPTMLANLGQLGLPSALSFFAGRGRSGVGLLRLGVFLALGLASVLLAGVIVALPWLETSVLRAAPGDLVRIALLSLPLQLLSSFTGAILIGRQAVRNYNLILIGQSALMLLGVVVLVGLLGMGAMGAVIANIAAVVAATLAILVEVRRSVVQDRSGGSTRFTELTGYGLKIYPASVAGFFNYRIDIFLLSAFLGDPSAIGLYTLAVSLAEMTFFVPDSVSTAFFPRVAGATRERADVMAPAVSRFTLMLTAMAAVGLVPVAFVLVHVVLPDFTSSLPAFLILLPGVISLSVAKVLASYIGGLGLPLTLAGVSVAAPVVNVVANLILIPLFGFVGAAVASLISYTLNAALIVVIASRLSRQSPLAFVLPGRAEWNRLVSGLPDLLPARLRRGG